MTSKIILIGNISDFNVIPKNIIKDENIKKISFDLDIHERLETGKIKHEISEELLDQDERLQIFDKMIKAREWYSKIQSKDYEIEGVNLFKMLDSHEFVSFLMPNLINLITIKRIIEKEKPSEIIITNNLSKIVESLIKNSNIKTKIYENDYNKSLLWDKITLKYNIGKFPITFNISKQTYLKIKSVLEGTVGIFYNIWFDFNNADKKSIIFLEFNPEYFSKLFGSTVFIPIQFPFGTLRKSLSDKQSHGTK